MLTRDDLIQVLTELRALGPRDIADHLILHWPGIIGQPDAAEHLCHCGRPGVQHLYMQKRGGCYDVWICEAHWAAVAAAFAPQPPIMERP